MRLHPGKANAYEAVCKAFMPKVRAAEPGVLLYEVGKSRDQADTYCVVEVYRDQAAMDEHMDSPFVKESMAALMDCIADLDIRLNDQI